MNKTAVVTGAGSGVGQAVVWKLAAQGWSVALLGRRSQALAQSIFNAPKGAETLVPFACDIGDATAVTETAEKILEKFGSVEVLVNAAGTNVPERSLDVLTLENYHRLLDTNLNGAYYCIQAFLPGMRRHNSGTIVNIISDAAKQASPKAGPAYAISKFGLLGLTQAVNAEEKGNGIRACALLPGDIDTPLLDLRPAPPSPEARQKMLLPEDIADCVMLAISLPARAIVEELLIRPR